MVSRKPPVALFFPRARPQTNKIEGEGAGREKQGRLQWVLRQCVEVSGVRKFQSLQLTGRSSWRAGGDGTGCLLGNGPELGWDLRGLPPHHCPVLLVQPWAYLFRLFW